jgi:hypothetical protein
LNASLSQPRFQRARARARAWVVSFRNRGAAVMPSTLPARFP